MAQYQATAFNPGSEHGYLFPDTVTRVQADFSKSSSSVSSGPGRDGGLDDYENLRSPLEPGRVIINFWLLTSTAEEMTAERDRLKKLINRGRKPLLFRPYDNAEPDRWCYAKLIEVQMPEDAENCTEVNQPVTMIFDVPEAKWYSRDNIDWLPLDQDIGDIPSIQGEKIFQELLGVTQPIEHTITHRGTIETPLKVQFVLSQPGWFIGDVDIEIGMPGLYIGGYPATSGPIEVQQFNQDGVLLEHWSWSGTLVNKEELIVDSTRYSVEHPGAQGNLSGYPEFEVIAGTGFILLQPGVNRLIFNIGSEVGWLKLFYDDAWI